MDNIWLFSLIKTLAERGVRDVCLCPSKRNAPLVTVISSIKSMQTFNHFEERSAAFFCLGRAKVTARPVAVCVTSGTAAGELLPATMEAYYNAIPLILITADRPRRYRGSGAPQSAEQKNLFGIYTPLHFDLEEGDSFTLDDWDGRSPLHLNICLEEPTPWTPSVVPEIAVNDFTPKQLPVCGSLKLQEFLHRVHHPLVVVSTLSPASRPSVAAFLEKMGAPVYAEAISGLRGTIRTGDEILKRATAANYPVDGILHIGGVPTIRIWRDLEHSSLPVLSISEIPFSGICNRPVVHTSLDILKEDFVFSHRYPSSLWQEIDQELTAQTAKLFTEEPNAEPSLVHTLSHRIPESARLYLGNSLPIREWDFAAIPNSPKDVFASRGLNGIDGQISTFLGLVDPFRENWGIFGDLTTLYDLAGPWALTVAHPEFEKTSIKIAVINNSGAMLFSRVGLGESFLNRHQLSFQPFADLWNIPYSRVEGGEEIPLHVGCQLIEIVPEEAATTRFWEKLKEIRNQALVRL